MAVIGWIKEEGSLVVSKEDRYLDSRVDEGFRLVGMRRATVGKQAFRADKDNVAKARDKLRKRYEGLLAS
ncbi:hypothetical protein MRB53_036027 [Persea americana]|uniref:Uncharacterized protein n=1 Tax=Persea americana TaxID=3435 RepID=A0ACC2K6A0_PERAE|nr:hypothetical protein MRB53_036027 [Persea americana]